MYRRSSLRERLTAPPDSYVPATPQHKKPQALALRARRKKGLK